MWRHSTLPAEFSAGAEAGPSAESSHEDSADELSDDEMLAEELNGDDESDAEFKSNGLGRHAVPVWMLAALSGGDLADPPPESPDDDRSDSEPRRLRGESPLPSREPESN